MNQEPLIPIHISQLLRKYDLRPNKRLGQNFLMDDSALRKIIAAAEIKRREIVIEIGPGLGSLTRYLAVEAYLVITVELDARFLPPLREVLAPHKNVVVIQGDILNQDIEATLLKHDPHGFSKGYLVVANIPYYITSAVIRHILESKVKPDRMILTVQKEVAMRICAAPPNMSLLALSVQVFGNPVISAKIPAGAFFPPPKVDSAIIQIDLYSSPLIPPPYLDVFFRLAKAGFSQKRKKLRNSLSAGMGLSKLKVEGLLNNVNIDYNRRAETLTMVEWRELTYSIWNDSPTSKSTLS
jgi:16S rRNA (adenine1518-N6/adenine1519-N6)-dimethyltransferase